MRSKRKKGRRNNKRILIPLLIVLVIIIAIAVALFQDQSGQPKHTAEEYFEISNVNYEGWKDENSDLWVTLVSFNLSTIEGDAHEVYVTPVSGMTSPIEVGDIKEGTSKTVLIQLSMAVYIHPEEEGFPFPITITCWEARGKITITLK